MTLTLLGSSDTGVELRFELDLLRQRLPLVGEPGEGDPSGGCIGQEPAIPAEVEVERSAALAGLKDPHGFRWLRQFPDGD